MILVAGVGNIFRGDDAFGLEVVKRLATRLNHPEVLIRDFGIRGLDLAYALLEGRYDPVILVDTVQRGGPPGTVYLIEPARDGSDTPTPREAMTETHGMHPAQVLEWVRAAGGKLGSVLLVGCEPAELGSDEDLRDGLSEPVAAAVAHAVRAVEELVREALCMS